MEILEADEVNMHVSSNLLLSSCELSLDITMLVPLYKSRISCIEGSSRILNRALLTLMSVKTPQSTRIYSAEGWIRYYFVILFFCVDVVQSSQPYGVMLSVISLPNHTFIGQA